MCLKAQDGKDFSNCIWVRYKKENEDLFDLYREIILIEILEEKLALLDSAVSLIFSSGMSFLILVTFLSPGDIMLFSNPVYGGSEYLFNVLLPSKGVKCVPFPVDHMMKF